ncbi:MAG: hypothetical protein JKX85_02460 [Phycisphaeraceae bacterium]|nr:hypothetical protein [Phycisphaeraceae bacterium]
MQLKSLFASLMALGFLVSPVFAGEGRARIDVVTNAGKLDFVQPENKKHKITHPNWIKNEAQKAQNVTSDLTVSDEKWTEITLQVTPSEDGNLVIFLRGQWDKTKRNWTYFDDISIEGAKIKNGGFEKTGNWHFPKSQQVLDESLAHLGKGAVLVWHNKPASQTVAVKGGVALKITAWVKFCKQEDQTPPVK